MRKRLLKDYADKTMVLFKDKDILSPVDVMEVCHINVAEAIEVVEYLKNLGAVKYE